MSTSVECSSESSWEQPTSTVRLTSESEIITLAARIRRKKYLCQTKKWLEKSFKAGANTLRLDISEGGTVG